MNNIYYPKSLRVEKIQILYSSKRGHQQVKVFYHSKEIESFDIPNIICDIINKSKGFEVAKK